MTVKTDTSGISLSTINPYTYRGYRYDKETNLYYLNSRYYNPQVMRFVNADGLIAATGGILSHNMYAYTANNPVMRIDPSGYLFWDVLDVIGFASSMMDFIGDPTSANLCWLAMDTVGLLPLLPSMGTYIKGVKYFGKVDDVGDVAKGTSKLDEVSILARNYKLDDLTYTDHILKRHGYGSPDYGFKNKFSSDFDVLGEIDEVLASSQSIMKPNTSGRAGYIFEKTYDSVIGYNKKGNELHTLKVVIEENGSVITAFPIR